jgi:hypothetical protein
MEENAEFLTATALAELLLMIKKIGDRVLEQKLKIQEIEDSIKWLKKKELKG